MCLYVVVKKYIFSSELWLKKKKKTERKKNHGFGALCHPFFMVLERAALSTHGRKLNHTKLHLRAFVQALADSIAGKKSERPRGSHHTKKESEKLHEIKTCF